MGNIIAIGELVVEVMANKVGQAMDNEGLWHGPFPSGAPAIMIAQAAISGANTAIIGSVGKDDFGRNITNRLALLNVNQQALRVDEHYTTGVAFVRYNTNGSRDFIYHIPHAASGQIEKSQVEESLFRQGGFLHITGSSLAVPAVAAAVELALDYCKKYDVKVSLDPNMRKELAISKAQKALFQKILAQTHILLPSEGELEFLTGDKDDNKSIKALLAQNIRIIVLKKGAQGAELITKNEHITAQACKVEEVDPTGAGDIFAGMLLACLAQNMSLSQALQYATAAGSYSVTRRGPMEGIAHFDSLSAYLPLLKSL